MLDRHDEIACRYRFGQVSQSLRARGGRATFGFDAVLAGRWEVDDGVDSLFGDAEFEGELDVAIADEIDERGHGSALGGGNDPITYTIAVGDGDRAALAQPRVMALAGYEVAQ